MEQKDRKVFTNYISENDIYIHHTLDHTRETSKRYDIEMHSRIELLYLISGKLSYTVNGETFKVTEGDLVVIKAHTPHELKIEAGIPYERIVLQFSPRHIPLLKNQDLLYPFSFSNNYRHILPNSLIANSKVKNILSRLCKISSSASLYKDTKLLSCIIELVAEIAIIFNKLKDSSKFIVPPKKQVDIIRNICDYINENITNKITIQEIADEFGISLSYLYHFFKKAMGINLRSYIEKQKMQYAKVMILQGLSAHEVSNALGYEYYATFCRQYKNTFGVPPKSHYTNPFLY